MHTDIPAEMRFSSTVSHRLSNMGALTKGDRRACSNLLEESESWNAYSKREVCIRILRDQLMLSTKLPASPPLSEGDVKLFLELPDTHSHNRTLIKLLNNLCECVSHLSEYTLQHRQTLLLCVDCMIPRSKAWFGGTLSPNTVDLFPHTFRERMSALEYCRNNWNARKTIGVLPDHVYNIIVQMLVQQECMLNCACLFEEFSDIGLQIKDMPTMPNYSIQNKLLGLNLASQNLFYTVLTDSMSFHCNKPKGAVSLEEHVLSKTKLRPNLKVNTDLLGRSECFLTVNVKVVPVNTSSQQGAPYYNVLSKEVFVVVIQGDEVLFFAPCCMNAYKKVHIRQWEEDVLAGKYVNSDAYSWNHRCVQKVKSIKSKARCLNAQYVLVVGDALKHWESSEKMLLRVENVLDTSFVALLYKVYKY